MATPINMIRSARNANQSDESWSSRRCHLGNFKELCSNDLFKSKKLTGENHMRFSKKLFIIHCFLLSVSLTFAQDLSTVVQTFQNAVKQVDKTLMTKDQPVNQQQTLPQTTDSRLIFDNAINQNARYFSNQVEMIDWAKTNDIDGLDILKLTESFMLVFKENGGVINGFVYEVDSQGKRFISPNGGCKATFFSNIMKIVAEEVNYANLYKSHSPPTFTTSPGIENLNGIKQYRTQLSNEMLFNVTRIEPNRRGEKDLECQHATTLINPIFNAFQFAKIQRIQEEIKLLQEKYNAAITATAVAADAAARQTALANNVSSATTSERPTTSSISTNNSQKTKYQSNQSGFSDLLAGTAVVIIVITLTMALISTPIALYLKFNGGIIIIENLTDAIFSITSLVLGLFFIAILSKSFDSSISEIMLSITSLLYLSWHVIWMHKVAKRSNSSTARIWLVTFARIFISCLPILYLFMGEKVIEGQKENETNAEYNNRYQKEVQENIDRKKGQSLFGWFILGLTTLSIEKFSFENLSSYFSRKTGFIKE